MGLGWVAPTDMQLLVRFFLFHPRRDNSRMTERFRTWLLLTGQRVSVAIGILIIMTGVVVIPNLARFAIQNMTPLFYIMSALIGGNITLITVVVAINQVILSQELETPGSLRDEIERTADFRQRALDQSTPPTDPSEFLQQLLQQTADHARALEGLFPTSVNGTNDWLQNGLPKQCEQASDQLGSASNTLAAVTVPLHGIDFADAIHDCYQLQSKYEEERDEQLLASLNALTSDLENLDIAQNYFTTAFIKEELATLSRFLVYVGIVAVSIPIALLYQLTTSPGASPTMPGVYAFTVLTIVVGLVPLALLIAFILRIATVTQYMASITPFKA